MSVLDTNHRWLVWRDRGVGDPHVFAAFDDRADADAIATLDRRLSVREHLAWLPTTSVRVRGGGVRIGQVYPSEGEILVAVDGGQPAGRGVVVELGQGEFTVAVPVIPPGAADGPSLWEIGRSLGGGAS